MPLGGRRMANATNVVANGSSTTAGLNGSNSYIGLYKVNNPEITFNNLARGGEVYTDLIARELQSMPSEWSGR